MILPVKLFTSAHAVAPAVITAALRDAAQPSLLITGFILSAGVVSLLQLPDAVI